MSTTIEQAALPVGTWDVDPVHSQVGFAVDYMAGTFRGSFSPVGARLDVAADGTAMLTGTAPVNGVKVQDENLEAHLLSPEFFDAEQTPEITFASTAIRAAGETVEIDGTLTIRGVTRPVTLTGTVGGPAPDAYGRDRFNLALGARVDRTDFGLNWNAPLPSGEQALSNEVALSAELYLLRAA